MHAGLDLTCTFEPFESRCKLVEALIAYTEVMHGNVVILVQEQCLLVALHSCGQLVMGSHRDSLSQPEVSISDQTQLFVTLFRI